MKKLQNPDNQLTEVLYFLLKKDNITFKQIHLDSGIINLSARLSDLKHDHNLPIKMNNQKTTNKFGRKINYGSWILQDKIKGLEIYNKLLKN